jgi:hypothetical protein
MMSHPSLDLKILDLTVSDDTNYLRKDAESQSRPTLKYDLPYNLNLSRGVIVLLYCSSLTSTKIYVLS